MSFAEAVRVAAEILKVVAVVAGLGWLAVTVGAWAWYKADGGKMGLIDWIRGI